MLEQKKYVYKIYKEKGWYYLVEQTPVETNYYIRKEDYGIYMLMFGLPEGKELKEEEMINKNKEMYKTLYNERY